MPAFLFLRYSIKTKTMFENIKQNLKKREIENFDFSTIGNFITPEIVQEKISEYLPTLLNYLNDFLAEQTKDIENVDGDLPPTFSFISNANDLFCSIMILNEKDGVVTLRKSLLNKTVTEIIKEGFLKQLKEHKKVNENYMVCPNCLSKNIVCGNDKLNEFYCYGCTHTFIVKNETKQITGTANG